MSKSIVRRTSFQTTPKKTKAEPVEVFRSGSLNNVNNVGTAKTPETSTQEFAGLPSVKIKETKEDKGFLEKLKKEGKSVADAVREVKNTLPPDASMKDILQSNKLSEVGVALKRLQGSFPGGSLGELNGEDLNFLLGKTNSLTKKLLSRDKSLKLEDLKNASGTDLAVGTAVGLFYVRQALGKNNDSGVWKVIGNTKIPSMLRDTALNEIVDLASESGRGDVVKALIGITQEQSTPQRQKTIKTLLRNFKFSDRPVVTELSKSSLNLIVSAGEFFGLNKSNANALGEIIESKVYKEEWVEKPEQAKRLIDSLYEIDPRWNNAVINGQVFSVLDNYQWASPDAAIALLGDKRTRAAYLIYKDRRPAKQSWKYIARKWNRNIYL